jgi:hypothetical protein
VFCHYKITSNKCKYNPDNGSNLLSLLSFASHLNFQIIGFLAVGWFRQKEGKDGIALAQELGKKNV